MSGALSKDSTTAAATGAVVNGVEMKYSAPAEKVLPTRPWRMYVFKGDDLLDTLHLTRHDHYLMGRDERVADVETMHGSCSEQVRGGEKRTIYPALTTNNSEPQPRPVFIIFGFSSSMPCCSSGGCCTLGRTPSTRGKKFAR